MKEGYIVKVIEGNDPQSLETQLNEFINSGLYEEMDDPIYYLYIAYIHYKPKVGVKTLNIYKWVLKNQSGYAVGNTPEEVNHLLIQKNIVGATITPAYKVLELNTDTHAKLI